MTNRIIAREGGIVYTRRGDDVYYALPGCLPRYYCGIARWPQSHAARRLRGELGPRARRTVAEVLAEDAALAAERERRQAQTDARNAAKRASRRETD